MHISAGISSQTHAPNWQDFVPVHGFTSVHTVPFATKESVGHEPPLQVSATSQGPAAARQTLLLGILRQPAAGSQESVVQILPSSQLTPVHKSGTQFGVPAQSGSLQSTSPSSSSSTPLAQFSATAAGWHVHAPDWQVFVPEQAFASVHAVPSASCADVEQTPFSGLHVLAV